MPFSQGAPPFSGDRALAAARAVLGTFAPAFGHELLVRAAQVDVVRNAEERRHEVRQLERPAKVDDFFKIIVLGKRKMERTDCGRPRL